MHRAKPLSAPACSRTRLANGLVLAGMGLLAVGIHAEARAQPSQPDATAESSGVYLNDSFEAADAIVKAQRLADRGAWTQAAQTLQHAAEVYSDRLMRRAPGHYVSVRRRIADMIARWPEAGIRVYRERYDADMADALLRFSQSRDVSALLGLLDQYFCTSGAAQLIDRIVALAIEAGDFALARRILRRCIASHPDRAERAPHWRATLLAVNAMDHRATDGGSDRKNPIPPPGRGDKPGQQKPGGHPTVSPTIRWMGKSWPLDDVLEQIRTSFANPLRTAAGNEWPIFGGRPDRTRIGQTAVDELGLLWRADVAPTQGTRAADEFFQQDGPDQRADKLIMQPVTKDGLLVVQHLRDVVALNMNTGAEIWRFSADAGVELDPDEFDEFSAGWHSPTIHGGRVYATLPGDMAPYYGYESVRSIAELVALDLATGQVLWRSNRLTHADVFADLHFDSSPIVADDRLYVVARKRRSFGFEDCYLLCFRTADGTELFRTHLGSASTASFGAQQAIVSIPAMAGDMIYVATNLGTVAAVQAHTGAVAWLRLYGRTGEANVHGTSWSTSQVKPWEFNPVMHHNHKVICLPLDADALIVYGEDDGAELLRIPRETIGDMRTILGVREDILCGSGAEVACYDLAKNALLWSSPLPRNEPVHGCGRWVGDGLYVPTSSALNLFDVRNGSLTSLPWDPEGLGGNLLALPDRIIVASARHVAAYVEKSEIWSSVRRRMQASPEDPNPALDLAEIAFGSGAFAEGLEALAEAVRRTEEFSTSLEPALKLRLFTDAVTFAGKLAARNRLTGDVLDQLQGIASTTAPGETDHVRFRISFSKLFVRLKRPKRAVRLLQQILQDRALRNVPMSGSLDGATTAADHARAGIRKLIAQHGRTIYDFFDRQATASLKIAIEQRSEDLLTRLVDSFPNSQAAPKALIARGELAGQAGDTAAAVATYSTAYHRYPDQVDRPALLRKIADTYERAGQPEYAYPWLTKAAREHPNARFEFGGRRVTFLQYRQRLEHVRKLIDPAYPHLELPLVRTFTLTLEPSALLLVPVFADQPGADWSRYFVRTEAGVQAYSSRSDKALWPQTAKTGGTSALLIATEHQAVFASNLRIFALDTATGALAWSHGREADEDSIERHDWEDENRFRRFALDRNRLVAGKENGELLCIDVATGEKRWARFDHPPAVRRIRIHSDWVVYDCLRGGETAVMVLNIADGSVIEIIDTGETSGVEDLFVTLDRQIILVTPRQVSAYQINPVQRRWHTSLQSQLERDTLRIDVDALYYCDNARGIKKISLNDGQRVWTAEQVLPRGQQEIAAHLIDSNILLSSTAVITAMDAITKLTLWEATTPEDARFLARIRTEHYFLAVHIPDAIQDRDAFAFFYDHRNASGLIAPNGGRLNLGRLEHIKTILAVDNTLLIQTGDTLHGWTHDAVPTMAAPPP